ncbi:MAG: hypothetical protein ACKOEI_02380, partial [Chthoniobacterales bacterium]
LSLSTLIPQPSTAPQLSPTAFSMIFYAWLIGAWSAVLWFFTFGVARKLFGLFRANGPAK